MYEKECRVRSLKKMVSFIARFLGNIIANCQDKKPHKRNFIKDIMENPEEFVLTAFIENDELSIKIRRKESKNELS